MDRKQIKLLPHQFEFLMNESSDPILLDGAWGATKTLALCSWALKEVQKYPNNQVLVGREHFTDLRDSTVRSFFELLDMSGIPRNYNQSSHTYTHPNGSEILFRHLDDESVIKNVNLGGAAIDQAEEIKRERFDYLLGRLRRPNTSRQMRLAANPNGHDWVWGMFYGAGSILWSSPFIEDKPAFSKDYRPGYQVIRCTSLDNHHLPEDYLEGLKNSLSLEMYAQYVLGSREVMPGYRFFNQKRLAQQPTYEPLAVGYFVDGFPKPVWREQAGGPIRVYERPQEFDRYVLGADVASGESTCRSAGVLLNSSLNRVALVIDEDLSTDEFALYCWLVSRYYKDALIVPERNGIGFGVVKALHALTGNIFSEQEGTIAGGTRVSDYGWWTDAKSRMALFATLQSHIGNATLELKDSALIDQCKAITMIHGKPKAEEGFRDDMVLALGIAAHVCKLKPSLKGTTKLEPAEAVPDVEVAQRDMYGYGRARLRVAGR